MRKKNNYIMLMLAMLLLANCSHILDNHILDNRIVLHEKSGSRELLQGRTNRDLENQNAAIKAFRLAMRSDYAHIKLEAGRELAQLLYAQRGAYDFEIVTLLQQAGNVNKQGEHREAVLGDKIAITMLGDYYAKKGNPETAMQLLEPIAEAHLPAKIALYGLYEARGDDMGARFAELLHQYEAENDAKWYPNMAKLYNRPNATFYNPTKALKYYKLIELQDDAGVLMKIAKILHFNAENQDLPQAAKYYEKAAKSGNIKAAQALNDAYKQGGWLQADAAKQRKWLKKLAQNGDIKASTELGFIAAKAGDAQAATKFFTPAIAADFRNNYEIAKKLYPNPLAKPYAMQALNGGDKRAISLMRQYYLGAWNNAAQTLAAEGFLRQNPALITPALAKKMAKSLKQYGQTAKAIEWLHRSANLGDVAAQKQLAEYYAVGENVEQDLPRSHLLYQKAANAGDSEAQYQLGLTYARGLGVEKNQDMARKWLQKSGKAGAESILMQ